MVSPGQRDERGQAVGGGAGAVGLNITRQASSPIVTGPRMASLVRLIPVRSSPEEAFTA